MDVKTKQAVIAALAGVLGFLLGMWVTIPLFTGSQHAAAKLEKRAIAADRQLAERKEKTR